MKTNITDFKSVPAPTAVADPHVSNIPADDPRLKSDTPRSPKLRRSPAVAVAFALAGLVLIALVMALRPERPQTPAEKAATAQTEISTRQDFAIPDSIKHAPDNSAPVGGVPSTPDAGSYFGRRPPPGNGQATATDPATDVTTYAPPDPVKAAKADEIARAQSSGLFFDVADPIEVPAGPPPGRNDPAPAPAPTSAPVSRDDDQNLQGRKNDFLHRAGVNNDEYNRQPMIAAQSPFEVKAGTIIPTVLITGINTDTPGQVIGQVRENVYDTVTGNHLLIPQGSRLLASYDSMMAFGQERVLLCWNRLIRPDGSSITLECMPGADLAGYAGVADEVDHHWWRVISGAALASMLAVGTASSQGSVNALRPTFPQLAAGAVAGQVAQTGQDLTSRNLRIQPTIKVRPGFSVNVIVSKDLVIPPYER